MSHHTITPFGIGPHGVSNPDHRPPEPPGPVAYSPEWVAACYGVTVNDPCPEVTVDFPRWAKVNQRHRWPVAPEVAP